MKPSHWKTLPIFALITLLLPALALAQGGPPADPAGGPGGPGFQRGPHDGGHLLGRLARALELTEEQIAATKELAQAHQQATQPLREEQRAHREAVRSLLEADPQDANAIGLEVIAGHTTGEAIRAAFEQLMTDFRALLTQEQEERLDEILAMRERMRGERGPGPGHRGRFGGGPNG